jgi:hypothetical protein
VWRLRRETLSNLYDAAEHPSGEKFTAVEDLKAFRLELLSYFESPPCQVALGKRDVIAVLREALPVWKDQT